MGKYRYKNQTNNNCKSYLVKEIKKNSNFPVSFVSAYHWRLSVIICWNVFPTIIIAHFYVKVFSMEIFIALHFRLNSIDICVQWTTSNNGTKQNSNVPIHQRGIKWDLNWNFYWIRIIIMCYCYVKSFIFLQLLIELQTISLVDRWIVLLLCVFIAYNIRNWYEI